MAELRRVLIVSPRFAPTAAPDAERARRLLPYLEENGWEGQVLAVKPELSSAPRDPWLLGTIPRDAAVHRAGGLGLKWAKTPGLGSVGVRSFIALFRRGNELLTSTRFDLVYFATTVTESFVLGPRWLQGSGVPFVIDYQDPWVNDYYREHPTVRPPGGRLKYGVVDALHRRMEPRVLRDCAGITSVSPEYPRQLEGRYPGLASVPSLVEPFPIPERDIQQLRSTPIKNRLFDPDDGFHHWLYMGAVVPGMMPAIRAVLMAVAEAPLEIRESLRIHFVGTSYASVRGGRRGVEVAARELGLQDVVSECPDRVPYSEALAAMSEAALLLAFGSDDLGYVASKVPLLLALGRPCLGLFLRGSAAAKLLLDVHPTGIVTFDDPPDVPALATQVRRFLEVHGPDRPPVAPMMLDRFTSKASAQRICDFFDECCHGA